MSVLDDDTLVQSGTRWTNCAPQGGHPPCASAKSTNRQSALISRIYSIVRARDSSSRGLATTTARHIARDTATFRPFRENRNSSVRGTSSALEVAIE